MEHYKNYSVKLWATYNQKRHLDELDGANIEVKFAGSCNGWTSLELYFPPCSRSIHVKLVPREVLAVVQIS